jgi:steroid 5-alpha reductase family enzyme
MNLELVHVVGLTIGCFVSALFMLSLIVRRNDIADIAWGIGIFLVALVSFLHVETAGPLQYALLVLAGLWGGRLSVRILLRNLKKEEDYRYKKWREEWRWFYLRSFLQVYLLQGFLMIVVGYSFVHAGLFPSESAVGWLQWVGVAVWSVGYFFEVVGDWQLDKFLADESNRGKIMQTGLWRYSRHPNYFGEVTMWWGIWLMVAQLPFGLVTLISPIAITILIFRVSGIPMLEKKFAGNPEFEAYKQRTSVFFPLPPKKVD